MSFSKISCGAVLLAAVSLLLLATAHPAFAQTETVLYNFGTNSPDGTQPYGGVVMDKSGNSYGVTNGGGAYNGGAVYELSASGTETLLYSFGASTTDGNGPMAGVIIDSKGNLYGTTVVGGTYGYGTAFELSPSSTGAWTETILHNFGASATDGTYPVAPLVIDKKGNLYGTTSSDNTNSSGTVFKLIPTTVTKKGKKTTTWAESVLYTFTNSDYPLAGLIMDKSGNLYGTTAYGGANAAGDVFEVTASGTETVLYSFGTTATDGNNPEGALLMDSKGNLYGTTMGSGAYNCGVLFELTPTTGAETVLYSFGATTTDGTYPSATLVEDKKSNFYGTSSSGGSTGYGTLFKVGQVTVVVNKKKTKVWEETILYNFGASSTDGQYPNGTLLMNTAGNLYGTTYAGGTNTDGTVFEVIP
jgi:uncharacterized repeat protein (TIGR03803 family)